jgi:hypothetical protein
LTSDLVGVKLNVNGLWKDTEHPAAPNNGDFHWLQDEYKKEDKENGINTDDPSYEGHPLCGPDSGAGLTFHDRGGTGPLDIFICPKAWDTVEYRTSISSLRTFTPSSSPWKQIKSLPGAFLHEMIHKIRSRPGGEKKTRIQTAVSVSEGV